MSRMQSMPRRLDCAETWAGNKNTATLIELPGLSAWVHSVPAAPGGGGGGDVHFLSVCPSCLVSRIALADVSGHGAAVEALGETLQQLMTQYLRELEQIELMRDLNQAVREQLDNVHYATMVAVGWHGRRGLLVLTNAGHPPPLWYRSSDDEWRWLEPGQPHDRERPTGVPLGLFPDINYERRVIKPGAADRLVLYSDGVSEALNAAGEELGRDGLLNIARGLNAGSVEAFGTELAAAVHQFRGGVEAADDETIIVLQRAD